MWVYLGATGLVCHPFPFCLWLYIANTYCIFSFFLLSLEYVKDSTLLLWHESEVIEVTNSNTHSESLIQWLSVKRLLRCVYNIDFQHKIGGRKENKSCFFFSQQVSNDNWHFYSAKTKTSLRAGFQWFEVHQEPVLSAAVSQLVATSSYYNNTTIALSQR